MSGKSTAQIDLSNESSGEDSMDESETMLESIKEAAKQARERLWSSKNPTYLSYLKENDNNQLMLHTFCCPPGSPTGEETEMSVKPVSLDNIYLKTDKNYLDIRVLTTDLPSTSSTITLPSYFRSNMSNNKLCPDKTNSISKNNPYNELIKNKDTASLNTSLDNNVDDSSLSTTILENNEEEMNENKEKLIEQLTNELLPYYGKDKSGIDYALSISRFGKNREYTYNLVASLLSVLTNGRHRIVSNKFNKLLEELFS